MRQREKVQPKHPVCQMLTKNKPHWQLLGARGAYSLGSSIHPNDSNQRSTHAIGLSLAAKHLEEYPPQKGDIAEPRSALFKMPSEQVRIATATAMKINDRTAMPVLGQPLSAAVNSQDEGCLKKEALRDPGPSFQVICHQAS